MAACLSQAAPFVSPINGRTLVQPEPGERYTFLLAGHSHGPSVYPVASLLVGIGWINRSGAKGLIFLGDTVEYPTPVHTRVFRQVTPGLASL